MIPRYTRKEMGLLWNDEYKYETWLLVELAVLSAHEEMTAGIPAGTTALIREKAQGKLRPERIDNIEAEVHHDVIAFTTHVAELVGESSRFFHMGLTSSDVLDTALAFTIKKAGIILLAECNKLLDELKQKSLQYIDMPIMGRTHGIHAEPTTLGLKLALCWEEINRGRVNLGQALLEASAGKISGAVGNYSQISPTIETRVGEILGLPMADISNQIVTRDRHARLLCQMAVLAGSLERLAVEVRLLQHTEINELNEPFARGQKGSSAMPHKRNPIICERISGLARLLRGFAHTAMENQPLWHERDISHSSAERMIIPDAFCILDYILNKTCWLVEGLDIHEQQIKDNLKLSLGLPFSQTVLISLVERGMLREDAYRIVQQAAFRAWEEKKDLRGLLEQELGSQFTTRDWDEMFDIGRFTKHARQIADRLWKNDN